MNKDYARITWPELMKTCGSVVVIPQPSSMDGIVSPGTRLPKFTCEMLSSDKLVRCCRLMCPIWKKLPRIDYTEPITSDEAMIFQQPNFALTPFLSEKNAKIITKEKEVNPELANMTFSEYLRGKPDEFQDKILGPNRAKVFREEGLDLTIHGFKNPDKEGE